MAKMVDLGIKRKDMHPAGQTVPASEKDYDNEKEYPELSLHGPHAEMMGAEDLKEGDVVEQKVRWRVKRRVKTEEGGKTNYELRMCLEKASDCEECEDDSKPKSDAIDDGDGADDSPAMAYITSRARSK